MSEFQNEYRRLFGGAKMSRRLGTKRCVGPHVYVMASPVFVRVGEDRKPMVIGAVRTMITFGGGAKMVEHWLKRNDGEVAVVCTLS